MLPVQYFYSLLTLKDLTSYIDNAYICIALINIYNFRGKKKQKTMKHLIATLNTNASLILFCICAITHFIIVYVRETDLKKCLSSIMYLLYLLTIVLFVSYDTANYIGVSHL